VEPVDDDLTDKVAVVTGAAGGIGLGLARAALGEGMKVVLSDVDPDRLESTVDVLRTAGGSVIGQPCDVRRRDEVEVLRDAALEAFGQVDLVCNNAGVGLVRPVLQTTDADWDLLFSVNVQGVVNGIRTFLPLMAGQGHGHLNATSSLSGLAGDPDLAVYNATKFAVVGLMEALALEMHRDHPGVTCSVLCPGPVATDLMSSSERHLTGAGAAPTKSSDRQQLIGSYLAEGLHPDQVGRVAIDGIKAGKFWLITHPGYTLAIIGPRFEGMGQGRLHVPDDWLDGGQGD
jgi:NAD(P)-dependent dehydrogenase (short-subunit alcohol dehydrogenase family)